MVMRRALISAAKAGGGRRFIASQAAATAKVDVKSLENDVISPKMPAFDYSPPPYTGPSAAEILKKRKEFLSPSMFTFYNHPVSYLFNSFLIFLT